ncbi:MAG: type II secretion system protein GspM [Gammaproteobacteria bacterium]
MELVPEQQNSRLTAVLLLVVTVILVYLVGFHWFFLRHAEYAAELDDLREQLHRFESVAAQRESLQARLTEIRESRDDADLFLSEGDFNEAAAAMSDRLGRMVEAQAEGDCQIVSRQPVRPRVEERYQRVTVNVRMRCGGEDLVRILYRLESAAPMVLVDDLNIIRPRVRRRVGRQIVENTEQLDVRFNMSGYLRS